MLYLLMFLSAATLSWLVALPVRSLALRWGVVDHPEKRKMHQIPIPLLGGLAIAASFAAVSMFAMNTGLLGEVSAGPYVGLLGGLAMILMLGVWDDTHGVQPLVKFGGQTLAALFVVASGIRMGLFTNPLGGSVEIGWLGIPLSVFWIVGVTNAVNLIDGLDGLAAGIGGIAALGMFAVVVPGNPFVAGLTIILAGAALGFLPHNFYPARMFLGDTGSMFIGFCLAVVGMHGSLKSTTATVLFLPIILLGMPIFDTLFAIFRRARRRVSPFKADREHIHHRLVRVGLHHRDVVLVLYFVCAFLALTAYAIAQFPYQTAFAFVALLTLGGILGIRTLQFVEEKLEASLANGTARANGAAAGRPAGKINGNGWRTGEFGMMMSEVAGFRPEFSETAEAQAMCRDIQSMLGRRLKVHAVMAEPSARGSFILLIRTEPLKPSLQAMVKDGLTWYFEDQRARFSDEPAFPAIRWIHTGPSAPPAPAPASETPRQAAPAAPGPFEHGERPDRRDDRREERREGGPRPLREGLLARPHGG